MALPKEPRQKMINIMYLVLTALLALNVSAEILNAFKTVDNSLTTTNKTIATSTSTILKSLQDKADDPNDPNNAKAKIWLPIAQNIQQLSSDTYDYVQGIRAKILSEAGFKPNSENKFDSSYKLDNLDIATRIMIEEKEGPKLKARLEKYRSDLLGLLNDPNMKILDADTRKQFENSIQLNLAPPKVQDKSNKAWEAAYFHMVPTVAAVTILSKFQNDVRTTENKAVAFCHQQVGHVVVRYDRFEPIIGQSTNYAMPGQTIEIKAGIGAFSSAAKPTITIGGQQQSVNDSGFVRYRTQAAPGLGQKTIPIHIVYRNQDGIMVPLDRTVTYTVGQASTAIALPEMNVLYIGYPNKVTVTAAGVGAEKISISAPGANIQRTGNGEFIVNVSNQNDNFIITASAEGKTVGSAAYRVRQIPEPSASVGGLKSGSYVNLPQLAAQTGVFAGIDNFPLPLKYTVNRFTVIGLTDDGDIIKEVCQGNLFSPRAKQIIRSAKGGDIISIEDIQVQGPGRSMKLPGLYFNIN
jgi:gliding motility-associated protein GldM